MKCSICLCCLVLGKEESHKMAILEVSSKWTQIARLMNFEPSEIQNIVEKCGDNPTDCCIELFRRRLQTQSGRKLESLLSILKKVLDPGIFEHIFQLQGDSHHPGTYNNIHMYATLIIVCIAILLAIYIYTYMYVHVFSLTAVVIPYDTKFWSGEKFLTTMANRKRFAKILLSKFFLFENFSYYAAYERCESR